MPDTTPDPAAREGYSDRMAELAADVWFAQKYPDPDCPARILRAEFMRGRSIYHRPLAERQADEIVSAVRTAAIREAADATDALIRDGEHDPDELVAELRGMAEGMPAASLPFGGHHEACAYVAGIGPYCTCNPTAAAPTATPTPEEH